MKKTFFMIFFIPAILIAQWSDDPYLNTRITDLAGEQVIPKVASNEGITYIGWYSSEGGNYNVRLQKLDEQGNEQWDHNGLLISDHQSMSWLTDWDMTIDQEDHAILTFQDIRNGGNNNIYAYRISPQGDFVWGADGLELSNSTAFDAAPKVVVTNSGNAVFSWQADDVIILQKISPQGDLLWGADGIVLSCDDTYSWPQLQPIGTDEIILKFFHDSGPAWAPTRHVLAQRLDADGNPVWASDTIISDAGGISAWTQIFPFINDGSDNFFIAWHDDRDNNTLASIFIQYFDSNGNILFSEDGIEVSTMPGRNHFYPDLAYLPIVDEVYLFWSEMDGDQNQRGLYGQKMNSDGERLWSDDGMAFFELSSQDKQSITVRPFSDNVVVFYQDYSFGNSVDSRVMAMRLDSFGNYVWENGQVALSSCQSSKIHQVVGKSCIDDQWIAAWEDERNDSGDIYAQNITIAGELGYSGTFAESCTSQETGLSLQNFPNPFRSTTTIFFETGNSSQIAQIEIFNVKGQKVASFPTVQRGTGGEVSWNADNFAPGIYFYKLNIPETPAGKMILVR